MAWVSRPGQYSPPRYGLGLVQVLVLYQVELLPQAAVVLEQFISGPHSDQIPLAKVRTMWFRII